MIKRNGQKFILQFSLLATLALVSQLSAPGKDARADATTTWESTYTVPGPQSPDDRELQEQRRQLLRREAEREQADARRDHEMDARERELDQLRSQQAQDEAAFNEAEKRMEYWSGQVKGRIERDQPDLWDALTTWNAPPDRKALNTATDQVRDLRAKLNSRAARIARLEKQVQGVHTYARAQVNETGRYRLDVQRQTSRLIRSPSPGDRQLALNARVNAGDSYYRARSLSINSDFLMQDMRLLQTKYRLSDTRMQAIESSLDTELNGSIIGRYIARRVHSEVARGCDLRETRCAIKGAQGLGSEIDGSLKGGKGGACIDDPVSSGYGDSDGYGDGSSKGKGGYGYGKPGGGGSDRSSYGKGGKPGSSDYGFFDDGSGLGSNKPGNAQYDDPGNGQYDPGVGKGQKPGSESSEGVRAPAARRAPPPAPAPPSASRPPRPPRIDEPADDSYSPPAPSVSEANPASASRGGVSGSGGETGLMDAQGNPIPASSFGG